MTRLSLKQNSAGDQAQKVCMIKHKKDVWFKELQNRLRSELLSTSLS